MDALFQHLSEAEIFIAIGVEEEDYESHCEQDDHAEHACGRHPRHDASTIELRPEPGKTGNGREDQKRRRRRDLMPSA